MSRVENERVRLEHSLEQLATTVETIRKYVGLAGNGAQMAETLLSSARIAAFQLVRLEAFEQALTPEPVDEDRRTD